MVRLDDQGTVLWQKTYYYSGGDLWSHVLPLPGGGFVATGEIVFSRLQPRDVWSSG